MACTKRSLVIRGWLTGCGVATGVFGAFALVSLGMAQGIHSIRFVGYVLALLFPLLLVFLSICAFTGIPAAAAIWLSEKLRIQSALFFGAFGAAMGALSYLIFPGSSLRPSWPVFVLFAVAGLAAGMAYWRIAGRYAGALLTR